MQVRDFWEEGGLLLKMLVTTAQLPTLHAANRLAAEDLPAEEADTGICQFFAGSGTLASHRLLGQDIEVFRETHELEDGGVTEAQVALLVFVFALGLIREAVPHPMADPASGRLLKII
jgi:hypothetical protein